MPGFGDILQKAVYLGVGLASYAGEKASSKLAELRTEAQKLADELVKRGEMSTEEGRRFVDEMMRQAQQQPPVEASGEPKKSEPRRIEILDDQEEPAKPEGQGVDQLRQQVQNLQDELRRLQQE
ncbi:MAG: phasin family protein [Actinomycetota bacterium]